MKIIFLGTPIFAATVLSTLAKTHHKILAVVTQPDRPNKRGNKTEPSEVKKVALDLGLPVLQFEKIRTEGVEVLRGLGADILVTAAYGQILSEEILHLAPHGVINVHASLLPKYRGSSPVQWAILRGETTLGVTIMQTAFAVDSGDILLSKKLELNGSENTEQALELLAPLGASALLAGLDQIEAGTAHFVPQNHAEATHFPMLKKEDGHLSFVATATECKNFIRAMTPWPGAYVTAGAGRLKVFCAEVIADESIGSAENCGKIVAMDTKNGILVQTAQGKLALCEVQAEGGKRMAASAYILGRKLTIGEVLK